MIVCLGSGCSVLYSLRSGEVWTLDPPTFRTCASQRATVAVSRLCSLGSPAGCACRYRSASESSSLRTPLLC